MSALAFFDTNIIVYTVDYAKPQKQHRADALFEEYRREDRVVVSLQVMQEYFAVVTRKLAVNPQVAQRQVEILADCRVVEFKSSDVISAIELHRLTQLSFWDALIVHAARISGAD